MLKVLITGNVRAEGRRIIEEFSEPILLPEPVLAAKLMERIGDVDAVLHKMGKLDRTVLGHQSRLQIIARHGVGLDDLDLDFIQKLGIPVTVTPGTNVNAVVEFTIGLMLALLRNIAQADYGMKRNACWDRESFMGSEISGLTVGIVGLGRIGGQVAAILEMLGARLIAYDPLVAPADHPVTMVTFEDLLSQSDIITFHCPLNETTRHMLNPQNIERVKKGALVINTARGNVLDPDTLVKALSDGRLGGAALDVYHQEPPDFKHPLFALDNVITTPHIAAMSDKAQTGMAVGAANEIKRVLVDKVPPLYPVPVVSVRGMDRRP